MQHKILSRYPLGNPTRQWKQDNFILSTFAISASSMRDSVENLQEAGFNLLELGWASHEEAEEALRLCEELDISLLFQDFTKFGGMQEKFLSDSLARKEVTDVVNHIKPWKKVLGYYVWDEPYIEDQLAEARRLVDQFEQEDPERLPFCVAIPSYNRLYTWQNGQFADYLERYAATINPPVLSLDYYPANRLYEAAVQFDKSLMWCDLAQMRALCRKYQMPLWFYYQGMNLSKCPVFTFPMIRMFMNAAAMYGAKGLQHYKAVDTVLDESGKKGPFFYEQQAIHKVFSKWGNTLMALENQFVFHSADVLPDSPYYESFRDDMKDSTILNGTLPARISVGELQDAYGNHYLFVLNRNVDVENSASLTFQKPSRIYEVSKESGRQVVVFEKVIEFSVKLAPGDAVLYRVQPAEDEAFTLEYRLEKAD